MGLVRIRGLVRMRGWLGFESGWRAGKKRASAVMLVKGARF